MQQETSTYHDVFLTKQPVFDGEGRLWGFELRYRGSRNPDGATSDNDLASLAVTAAASLCPTDGLSEDIRIALAFSAKSILAGVPEALPPGNLIVVIRETQANNPDLKLSLTHLAERGYRIAVNDYRARPDAEWLLAMADYLFIDMADAPPQEIAHTASRGGIAGKQLVARQVDDVQTRQLAATIGCSLFQGYFFKQPEIVSRRSLSSHEAGRLRLLKLIQRGDQALEELAEAIRADVALSYRLISYLNTPFFGMRHTIRSVEQAVTLLGWRQMVDWLRVIILADFANGDAARELAFASVQRARFLELAACKADMHADMARSRFLLGLFSLLDVMLATPMNELLDPMNLELEIRAALLGEQNEASAWLGLAIAFEKGDWKGLDAAMSAMDLDPAMIARSYAESLDWTALLLMEPPMNAR